MNQATMVAAQYRLQEWAAQIKECNNRPNGITVDEWCSNYGITKANYYYRLKRVREAYLADVFKEIPEAPVVPVQIATTKPNPLPSSELQISTNGFSIRVTESTSMELLAKVLEVVAHAQ
jgi:hypothetical protein